MVSDGMRVRRPMHPSTAMNFRVVNLQRSENRVGYYPQGHLSISTKFTVYHTRGTTILYIMKNSRLNQHSNFSHLGEIIVF